MLVWLRTDAIWILQTTMVSCFVIKVTRLFTSTTVYRLISCRKDIAFVVDALNTMRVEQLRHDKHIE